jgi:serum/glucocorticoid-regulated kinase 2
VPLLPFFVHNEIFCSHFPPSAPYIPPIDPSNASDTQNFDDTFLDMEPVLDEFNDEATDTDQEPQTDADRTDGDDTNTTPSQSRSSSIRPLQHQPQQQPLPVAPPLTEDDVDLFDGYSFKGRHSVLIDDEEEDEVSGSDEAEGESTDEEQDGRDLAVLQGLEQQQQQVVAVDTVEEPRLEGGGEMEDEAEQEPKTPEARPTLALSPVVEDVITPVAPPVVETRVEEEIKEVPRMEEPLPAAPAGEEVAKGAATSLPTQVVAAPAAAPPSSTSTETSGRTTPPSSKISSLVASRLPANARSARPRKERSGVPALDRYLSDAVDEDTELTEAEQGEDDDWDFIEAADGEDRNGAKGTSLFARGVVDRYRLAVFRKSSTPNARAGQRSVSGMSTASTATEMESPSPTQRRGRAPGLTFRKHPRQFLRPKSPPPSSFSAKSARSVSQSASASNSNSNTMSGASTAALLTPSLSVGSSTFALPHSLKSKESATSVGAQSHSSGQSGNGQSAVFVEMADTLRTSPPQVNGREPKPPKSKKLKKYKNNAEKVFSLFSSPRQTS